MCWKCGTFKQLKPQPRSFLHRILSLQRFRCDRCVGMQTSLRFDWTTVVRVFLLCALGAGAVMARKPDWFRISTPTPRHQSYSLKAASTTGGRLIAFEKGTSGPQKTTLDNAAILKLWQAGVERDVIVQMIRTSNGDYDISANAIIELRHEQVDSMVMLAMIDRSFVRFR